MGSDRPQRDFNHPDFLRNFRREWTLRAHGPQFGFQSLRCGLGSDTQGISDDARGRKVVYENSEMRPS
jgi:hypothetical protein